jgi:hypothetical protein
MYDTWNKVEDVMPEQETRVLVSHGSIDIAIYIKSVDSWYTASSGRHYLILGKVTHWASLPHQPV